MTDLATLSRADRQQFVTLLSGIFEASPWVAEAAWARRPFADLDALHGAMVGAVLGAARERQLALIRAHPDLAGTQAQQGRLSADSAAEQKSAGLERLSADEFQRLTAHNAAYRAKFGFPFIICVRNHGKTGIFTAMEERLANSPAAEFGLALHEIYAIARLRLEGLVDQVQRRP